VELILERGRGLTYTPRRESRFRGPRSIDRFAAVLEPGAQFGENYFFPTIGAAVSSYLETNNDVEWQDWEDD